jgi:pimeloyl-ACP methyl ester carboxylesterase
MATASTPNKSPIAFTDTGTGLPLVLLHAFPLSREMWAPQAVLAEEFRLVTPDLYGFGATALPPGGWTMDSMADALADWLTGLKVAESVVLGGLSMGGYVALAFARRHPGLLRGLILADTKADADTIEGRAGRDKMIAFVRENSAADVVEQLLPKLLGETTRARNPDVADAVRSIGTPQTRDGVAAALAALRDRPDATPGLSTIQVPTLVIVGAEDTLTPPAAAKSLAGGIAGAKLVEIPGAGHLSNLEAPNEFNAAVRAFAGRV